MLKTTETLEAPAPPVEKTIYLELAFCKRYMRQSRLYEKGILYKFLASQAAILLAEQDNSRSIWKVHRKNKEGVAVALVPPKPKGPLVMDETKLKISHNPVSEDPTYVSIDGPNRIEIGNDEEIEAILNTGDVVEV